MCVCVPSNPIIPPSKRARVCIGSIGFSLGFSSLFHFNFPMEHTKQQPFFQQYGKKGGPSTGDENNGDTMATTNGQQRAKEEKATEEHSPFKQPVNRCDMTGGGLLGPKEMSRVGSCFYSGSFPENNPASSLFRFRVH